MCMCVFVCLCVLHLFIHSSVGHLGCFHILAIVNNANKLRSIYLFELVYFFSDIHPGVELAGSFGSSFYLFFRNFHTVFPVAALCTSTSTGQAFPLPFLFYPYQCLLFVLFLMIAILIGVRRCLTVILICISLMINDVEHLSSLVFKWYPYKYKFSLILNSLCHSIDLFDYFLTIDNVTKLLKIYRVLW